MSVGRSFSCIAVVIIASFVLGAATAQALTVSLAKFDLNSGSTLNGTITTDVGSQTNTVALTGDFYANLDVTMNGLTPTINTMGLTPLVQEYLSGTEYISSPGEIHVGDMSFTFTNGSDTATISATNLIADFKTVGLSSSTPHQFPYSANYQNMTVTGTSVPTVTDTLCDVAMFNGGRIRETYNGNEVYDSDYPGKHLTTPDYTYNPIAPGHQHDLEGAFTGASNGTITVGASTVSGKYRNYALTLALPVNFNESLIACSGVLNATSSFSVTAAAGDADVNGTVNGADLNTVLSNYNKTGQTWNTGDFDNNGTVNGADLNVVLSNYNHSGWGVSAAVPEPASVVLLAALLPIAAWIVRRRSRG